jgi:hypothetical protein
VNTSVAPPANCDKLRLEEESVVVVGVGERVDVRKADPRRSRVG